MRSPCFLIFIALPRAVLSIMLIFYSVESECDYPTSEWIPLRSDQWSLVDGIYTFVIVSVFSFYTIASYLGINFQRWIFPYYLINGLCYFAWFIIGSVLLFQSQEECGYSTLWKITLSNLISVLVWNLYYLYKGITLRSEDVYIDDSVLEEI